MRVGADSSRETPVASETKLPDVHAAFLITWGFRNSNPQYPSPRLRYRIPVPGCATGLIKIFMLGLCRWLVMAISDSPSNSPAGRKACCRLQNC